MNQSLSLEDHHSLTLLSLRFSLSRFHYSSFPRFPFFPDLFPFFHRLGLTEREREHPESRESHHHSTSPPFPFASIRRLRLRQWSCLGFRRRDSIAVDVAHGEDDCLSGQARPARARHSLGNFSPFSLFLSLHLKFTFTSASSVG